jgi:hypothetical protein
VAGRRIGRRARTRRRAPMPAAATRRIRGAPHTAVDHVCSRECCRAAPTGATSATAILGGRPSTLSEVALRHVHPPHPAAQHPISTRAHQSTHTYGTDSRRLRTLASADQSPGVEWVAISATTPSIADPLAGATAHNRFIEPRPRYISTHATSSSDATNARNNSDRCNDVMEYQYWRVR